MPPHNPDTPTERALESELHVHASRHYALRADQLEDGTYRYALEDTRSGTALAEGVDPDARAAVALFERSLDRAGLSDEETVGLKQAAHTYHDTQ